LAEETALLRQAHAAIESGDGARALALLDQHARTYPSGALGEERDAARVFALCAASRAAEARREADRFLATHPRSPLAPRVRASCGGR
jgi:outer membrane protein assembly factor BamD (BamD/ComL family)